MKIDMTYELEKDWMDQFIKTAADSSFSKFGHFGTHFDIQDKSFDLEYGERNGIIFDAGNIGDREIETADIDIDAVKEKDFVLIRTGMIERAGYGSREYFKEHPQLSHDLIHRLILKRASLIGLDMAGVRRGAEHAKADQLLADHGTFVVENLVHLDQVLRQAREGRSFIVHTYPMKLIGFTGLPCRVVAEFYEYPNASPLDN